MAEPGGSREPAYLLFEPANAHGGEVRILEQTIEAFSLVTYDRKGIKFQAFAPDTIALPDFDVYDLYRRLSLDPGSWSRLIALAKRSGDVWLDIFDVFGVELLAQNRSSVRGVKLQASVLENLEVRDALHSVGASDFEVILNVSGFELPAIRRLVSEFRSLTRDVILQVGFQAYPTKVADTGLAKLRALHDADLGCRLALADHADGATPFALTVPTLGFALGCDLIEKHFVLSRAEAEFDAYSALEPGEMRVLAQLLLDAHAAMGGAFINDSEAEYLASTVQQPVTRHSMRTGELVGPEDVLYRRTGQQGMTLEQIRQTQQQCKVLSRPIDEHRVIGPHDYRDARVATIVAGRLKSSRLPRKALVPIGGIASTERCLMQCSAISTSHQTILATSDLEADTPLAEYPFDRLGSEFAVWRGDPTDVIDRYLGAAAQHGVDVIVRATADCPFISPEIAGLLIAEHFAAGADYTAPRNTAVGTAVEVINVAALQRVQDHFGRCEHAEYMTWYFQNNRDVFKVHIVDLPSELVRDYRLTLDYPEDLEMFEALVGELGASDRIIGIAEIFELLDAAPSLAAVNQHLSLRYRTDAELIETLDRETRIRGDVER